MINIRIAVFVFKDPDIFLLNKRGTRLSGILGDYYQQLFDKFNWNITYLNKDEIRKKAGFFNKTKFDNDDVFTVKLVEENLADLSFRQISLSGEILNSNNIRISPVVSAGSVRLLQCTHRKEDYNTRDILYGLNNLPFDFWLKLSFIFIFLSILLIATFFVKSRYKPLLRRTIGLRTKLNFLFVVLFFLYIRIITRQSSQRRWHNNLNYVPYCILLVTILFTFVIHQLLFNSAFVDLKFRNTSYILRDLEQVLKDPDLEPCFLQSEIVVESQLNDTKSIIFKLYHHKKKVCYLSSLISGRNRRASTRKSTASSRLFSSILVGSEEYVVYFGYLFCNKYSDFIQVMLKQMIGKEPNQEPLFWYPIFKGEETLQAFFINRQTSNKVQEAINSKFVYRAFEYGWILFLKCIKHKIDVDHAEGKCFTSDYRRISFPYRFNHLIIENYYFIFNFALLVYSVLLLCLTLKWIFNFFNQNIQIRWIK